MSAITMIVVAACMTSAFQESSSGSRTLPPDGASTKTTPPAAAPTPPRRTDGAENPNSVSPNPTPDSGAPDFPDDVRVMVAARLLFEGRLEDAATVAGTVVAQRPDCDRGKFMLGLIRHKQQRYDDARPLLEAAMLSKQPFPERDHTSYYLGWCCYHMKDLKAAKQYFEIHVAHWPNYDDSHFGLGVIALDEDRLDDAEAALTTALRLQDSLEAQNAADRKSRSKTMARLGDVAARQKKLDLAITRYESAVAAWPDHPEAWAALAKLYRSAGKEADAKRADDGEREALTRARRGAAGEKKPVAPAASETPEKPAPPPAKGAG